MSKSLKTQSASDPSQWSNAKIEREWPGALDPEKPSTSYKAPYIPEFVFTIKVNRRYQKYKRICKSAEELHSRMKRFYTKAEKMMQKLVVKDPGNEKYERMLARAQSTLSWMTLNWVTDEWNGELMGWNEFY